MHFEDEEIGICNWLLIVFTWHHSLESINNLEWIIEETGSQLDWWINNNNNSINVNWLDDNSKKTNNFSNWCFVTHHSMQACVWFWSMRLEEKIGDVAVMVGCLTSCSEEMYVMPYTIGCLLSNGMHDSVVVFWSGKWVREGIYFMVTVSCWHNNWYWWVNNVGVWNDRYYLFMMVVVVKEDILVEGDMLWVWLWWLCVRVFF